MEKQDRFDTLAPRLQAFIDDPPELDFKASGTGIYAEINEGGHARSTPMVEPRRLLAQAADELTDIIVSRAQARARDFIEELRHAAIAEAEENTAALKGGIG